MATAKDQRAADVAMLRKLCADTHHPTVKSAYKDAADALEAAPLVGYESASSKPAPEPKAEKPKKPKSE